MILSFRQIKSRIRGIQNTEKLVDAMEKISIVKLRPLQRQINNSSRYFIKLEEMVKNLLAAQNTGRDHPLLENRPIKKRICLCVVTADNGLCGVYNHNILKLADKFIQENSHHDIELVIVGKKGLNYFRDSGHKIAESYVDLHGRPGIDFIKDIAEKLVSLFLLKEADEIYFAYTYFKSASRHKILIEKLLNIDAPKKSDMDYIFEPGPDIILESLISIYVMDKIKFIFLNAFAAEQSARAIAMGQATENAQELLEKLILLRNKVRQANITRELLEIISAADALKG